MSDTGSLNIVNLQVFAEAVAEADKQAGTYEANLAANPQYYIWQSEFQTIPMDMHGNPEQFVAQMVAALPLVNTIRIPFNIHSFNPDGTLDPQFERFLAAAASHGLQLIPVLADGGAQQQDGSSEAISDALAGPIYADMQEAWLLMKSWMSAHPDVDAAVYGWELVNEPAAYKRAVVNASLQEKSAVEEAMVELFVSHMESLAELVAQNSDARILVPVWGYNGDTATLANNTVNGETAIDALRQAIGDALVWSLHYYPGWMGTEEISNPTALQAAWSRFMAPLGLDDVLITEINVPGLVTYSPMQDGGVETATALSLEWLKASGVGIGWFPALQTGASSLALIERDGEIRYLNQPSLAAALDAFSTGLSTPDQDNAALVRTTLVEAALRNQIGDVDYPDGRLDSVSEAGFAFGYGGDDTLVGAASANNFLYGGWGNDLISGAEHDDFLYGQDGGDFIVSGLGVDYMFGGNGNDTVLGYGEHNTAYGGQGADLFVVTGGARFVIADFSAAQGDSWMGPTTTRYDGSEIRDVNGDGIRDLVATFTDQTELVFLGTGEGSAIVSTLNGMVLATQSVVEMADALLSYAHTTPGSAPPLVWPDISAAAPRSSPLNFTGQNTADEMIGGTGNDTINGAGGSDVMFAGAGDDQLDGGTGNDLVFSLEGDDYLYGSSGTDSLFGGVGRDRIIGGDGEDIIGGGNDHDTLSAGAGEDLIAGEGGDDRLYSGAGNDSLFGGDGRDRMAGGLGNDILEGGSGLDIALFFGLRAVAVNLAIQGQQSTGHGLDELKGFEGIVSGNGNDRLIGNGQANVLHSGTGHDRVAGGAGFDTLSGFSGRDTLIGGTGNDLMLGGADADKLRGDKGNDTLGGGGGQDTLIGGDGSDSFLFVASLGTNNVDRIADFNRHFDTIVLDSAVFSGITDGKLAASAFSASFSGLAQDALDRVIYERDTGKLFYDIDGSGAAIAIQFAQVSPWLKLTSDDFWISE